MKKTLTENEFANIIRNNNGRIFLAGGYVRDEILGETPHDKDYVVTGLSEEKFSSLFSNAKKTGGRFPVFRIYIDGISSEVALARCEKKTGEGYRGFTPIVSPEVTIEEDLYRRDATMNSVAKELPMGNIIDPYGGVEDAKNGVIRATSKHFLEDPVRALRAARQAAEHDLVIEENTLKMMEQCKDELQNEPTERFFHEMEKALKGKKPSLFFKLLQKTNLLDVTFKEIFDLIGKTQPEAFHPEGDAFIHSMLILDKVAAKTDSVTARFAALSHDLGKGRTPFEMLPHHYGHEKIGLEVLIDWNKRMTLPQKWKKAASFAISEHMRAARVTKPGKMVNILTAVKKSFLSVEEFAVIIEADNGKMPPYLKDGRELLEKMESVRGQDAPENLDGMGIKNWIFSERIKILQTKKLF